MVAKLILLPLLLLYLFFVVASNLVDSGYLLRLSIPISVPSTAKGQRELPTGRIAIVVVLKDEKAREEYALAKATLHCYAAVQNYPLHYIYMTRKGAEHIKADDAAWHATVMEKCFDGIDHLAEESKGVYQGKFFFIRHCAVVELMLVHSDYEWMYVLDGDVGVADATHRLEEWIDERADVIFYEREWSWSIMAGSYLVRNSVGGRRFLNAWVNTHIASDLYHDNGALRWLFLQLFATQAERDRCNGIYFVSRDLFLFTVCTRYVLNRHTINANDHDYFYRNNTIGVRVKLLPHGLQWSRDANADVCIWWSPGRDFMLHGWKESNQVPHPNNSKGGGAWSSPFVDTMVNGSVAPFASEEECNREVESRGREEAIDRFWRQRWRADIIVSREELETQLAKVANKLATRFADAINKYKLHEIA